MFTVDVTIDNVIDALKAFIQPYCGASVIVRAQTNRVAMPPNPCVILTELRHEDLALPIIVYDHVSAKTVQQSSKLTIQIDFYGASAGDYCKAVTMAFRSHEAFDAFGVSVKPLYCGDGMQSPLITGEQQYESRWTIEAYLQYNPILQISQQYADVLTPVIETPVDIL